MISEQADARIRLYNDRFAKLNQREKILVSITCLFSIILLGFSLLIDPDLMQVQDNHKQLKTLQTELSQLETSEDEYTKALQIDINLPLNQQIQQLEQKLMRADKNIAAVSDQLVNAKQMSQMLEAMLSQTDTLKLIKLSALPAENLLSKQEQPQDTQTSAPQISTKKPEIGLFKQGIALTIEGSYPAIYQFLQQAEQLPWRFYWRKFNYQVTQYPLAQLELEIITFSLTEGFVGL